MASTDRNYTDREKDHPAPLPPAEKCYCLRRDGRLWVLVERSCLGGRVLHEVTNEPDIWQAQMGRLRRLLTEGM